MSDGKANSEQGAVVAESAISSNTNTWPTLVRNLLSSRNVTPRLESPGSCKQLFEKGKLFRCTESHVGKEIESMILESFMDDLYEGQLHMLTLLESTSGLAVGFVLWRDVEPIEMKDWLVDPEATRSVLNSTRSQRAALLPPSSNSFSSLLPVPKDNKAGFAVVPSQLRASLCQDAACGWIKIELVCTRPSWYGRGVGTMLLASCLVFAWLHQKQHAVLHVAGGELNVPALRLYRKFGFMAVGERSFHKPNKNMFILPHIGQTLGAMNWQRLLLQKQQVPEERLVESSAGDKAMRISSDDTTR